jgi:hypothetical protein
MIANEDTVGDYKKYVTGYKVSMLRSAALVRIANNEFIVFRYGQQHVTVYTDSSILVLMLLK